jgi:hypothetical protein
VDVWTAGDLLRGMAGGGLAAALWSFRPMFWRAFLNSFMLSPKIRARSGNFFAPNKTSTIKGMSNRSSPPRFSIPNARIFINFYRPNGLQPTIIPENSRIHVDDHCVLAFGH